jgi:hypothetical protein
MGSKSVLACSKFEKLESYHRFGTFWQTWKRLAVNESSGS